MIKAIYSGAEKNNNKTSSPRSFKGLDGVLSAGLQYCEKFPMLNVAVVDATTAIVPRTIYEGKTNPYAGAEAFRRESSGLIVHCLLPSFAVLGIAKLLPKAMLKDKKNGVDFSGINFSNSWATEESVEKLTSLYKEGKSSAEGKIRDYSKALINNLEGLNSEAKGGWKAFSECKLEEVSDELSKVIKNTKMSKKDTKKALSGIYKAIVEKTGAEQILRLSTKPSEQTSDVLQVNLKEWLRDGVDIGRKLQNPVVENNLDSFVKISKKFINTKSLMGLGMIIPIAMSMQAINRHITAKKSGQKGAPIYKDFASTNISGEPKRNTPATAPEKEKDKKGLLLSKILGASAIVGVGALSMMKKPSLKMFQFKGMFPTLDQCRWIAVAAFASRTFAAEDKNEVKEATTRDIATFSSLYFLGDFAAKGIASAAEKLPKYKGKLLNKIEPAGAKSAQKGLWKWLKNTKLKSFDETLTKEAKNMRSWCQIGNLAVSMALLGLLIPIYTRTMTEKKVKKEKELFTKHQQNAIKLSLTFGDASEKKPQFAAFKIK